MKGTEDDLIWTRLMQPKQRFIVWLARQERLLKKERLERTQVPVTEDACCLCEEGLTETQNRLLSECSWVTEVRRVVSLARNSDTEAWGKTNNKMDQNKALETIEKGVDHGSLGAMIYYTCQARNWKQFRNINANTSFVKEQIQKETKHRLDMIQGTKRARGCQVLIRRLCN